MAKALGTTPEEEYRPGLAPLARVSDKLHHRSHNRSPLYVSFSK